MELKGSRTEQNLIAAFAGESEARNKYTYYAAKAREDGYEQIADLFQETADNEKAHAKLWFEQLHGIHTTEENLKDAAAGEHFEWSEKEHEERYLKLLENVENKLVFSKDGDAVWVCMNCGHVHTGKTAPAVCPVCAYPQGYFEEKKTNY